MTNQVRFSASKTIKKICKHQVLETFSQR